MKKRFIYFFIGVFVLLAIGYFLRYKQASSINNKVPINATAVINIDLRQIEHHILIDVLTNPLSYIDFKSSKKKKDSLSILDAISIPKNIFFYTNDTDFKGFWLSSIVKIKDTQELYEYLSREQFKKNRENNFTIYKKNRIELVIKNEQLIIAFNNSKMESIPIFQTVFKNTNFLSKGAKLFIPIVNSKSDICYSSLNDDFLEVNFRKGAFDLVGTFKSDFFIIEKQREFSYNSIASVTTKINKDHKFFSAYLSDEKLPKFKEVTNLSLDSILRKWNGSIDFKLKSINSKTDTIITYEYDDDFNKKEKVTTQKLVVPDLELFLGSEKDSTLYNYFKQKKAIQIIESDTLFTSMPLNKLYANSTSSTLIISSQNDISGISVKENKIKLNAYFNIKKYMQKPLEFSFIPTKNSFLQLIKDTSVQLSNKNELFVKVNLKSAKRNFIGQFIKP